MEKVEMKDDIIDIINNEDSLDRERLDEKFGTDTAYLRFNEFKRILLQQQEEEVNNNNNNNN
tara:strand:+ start:466 stop:651 length:186 start_codon:yes stop_codon:yes gene_type:complete